MKKILLLVVLALLGVVTWYFWETKPKPDNEVAPAKPIKASQHSAAFNSAVDSALQTYFTLSETLVSWDSANVNQQAARFQNQFAALNWEEIRKDSLVYQSAMPYLENTKKEATVLQSKTGLEQKRRAFHSLSQNLYDLLRTVGFDASPVYLQECPMAFNDEETGNWLSKTSAIRNPYLGLHHPKYKSGMLECGETKDSLAFVQVQ